MIQTSSRVGGGGGGEGGRPMTSPGPTYRINSSRPTSMRRRLKSSKQKMALPKPIRGTSPSLIRRPKSSCGSGLRVTVTAWMGADTVIPKKRKEKKIRAQTEYRPQTAAGRYVTKAFSVKKKLTFGDEIKDEEEEEKEEEEESYLENEHGNSLSIRPITSVGEKSSKKSFLMKNPSYLSGGASQNEGGEMMRSIPDDVKRSCSQSTLMRDDTEYPSAKPCALITMRALGIKEFPAPILLLGNLLEEIDLSRNNIKVLPPSISSLRKLKKLNLAYNKIEVLPNNFEELQHLEVLNVDVNKMSIFPPQICALSNLKILSFRFNTIKRIPKELNRLSNVIEHVKLEGNSPSLMANLLSTCPALGSALTEKSLFSKNYRFSASALPKMLDEALGDKLDDEGVVVLRLGDDGDDSKPPQKNGRH